MKLTHSFSLLLLLLSGCVKKTPPAISLPAESSSVASTSSLIISSPYVQPASAQPVAVTEQLLPAAPERIYTTQELFTEVEARAYDVYFPLGYVPTRCQTHGQETLVEGTVEGSLDDTLRGCMQNMERAGWATSVVAASTEPALVVFTKPGRSCSYSLVSCKPSWFSKKQSLTITIWITYRA